MPTTSPRRILALPPRSRRWVWRSAMRSLLVLVALTSVASADSTDFSPQVRAMFRVAACGGDDAIPDKFPAKTIDAHCQEMKAVYTSYKKAWADGVQEFVAKLRPSDIPTTVVYP